jgi:hypothetical protein
MRRFLLGAIKAPPPCPLCLFGHLLHLQTLWNSLLSSNLLSLKFHSNPSFLREIWATLLSDPQNLQAKHFIDDLRVFVTLGDLSPRWTMVVWESPRLWRTSKSLYCPLLRGDMIVKTELNLGDCSGSFGIERDPALCWHLNGDIGNLCGLPTFGNKSCVTCACLLRFTFHFLLKFVLALSLT